MNISRVLLLLPVSALLSGCGMFKDGDGEDYDDAQEMQEHPRRAELLPSIFGPGRERLSSGKFPPVRFEGSSWDIPRAELAKVKGVARWLLGNPHRMLLTAGAEAGSPEYSRQLSDLRAQSVKQSLMDSGVPGARLLTAGFGEDMPGVPENGVAFSVIRTGEEPAAQ
jgi:outer membrane protein OmpA-like peptidoglycan-associated protein